MTPGSSWLACGRSTRPAGPWLSSEQRLQLRVIAAEALVERACDDPIHTAHRPRELVRGSPDAGSAHADHGQCVEAVHEVVDNGGPFAHLEAAHETRQRAEDRVALD